MEFSMIELVNLLEGEKIGYWIWVIMNLCRVDIPFRDEPRKPKSFLGPAKNIDDQEVGKVIEKKLNSLVQIEHDEISIRSTNHIFYEPTTPFSPHVIPFSLFLLINSPFRLHPSISIPLLYLSILFLFQQQQWSHSLNRQLNSIGVLLLQQLHCRLWEMGRFLLLFHSSIATWTMMVFNNLL